MVKTTACENPLSRLPENLVFQPVLQQCSAAHLHLLAFSAKMADNCSWKYSTSYIIYLLQLLFADFWHKEKGTINEVCVFKTIYVSTDRQTECKSRPRNIPWKPACSLTTFMSSHLDLYL